MNINTLTLFVILINVSLLFGEIPNVIIGYTVFITLLSLISSRIKFQLLLKIIFLICAFYLLKHSFPKITQAESAISFVFILAGLKSWELNNENDHFNMFLILALSEAGIYLLNPNFIIFIFGILKTVFYFYYILTIRKHRLAQINFKRLFMLITPSIIFALILFYTFPRFTQGFINTSNSAALFIGNRADLNFKELGPLNLSANKVFKVYGLNNTLKNPESTYWRQMVLWDYHLSEWRSGNLNLVSKEKKSLSSMPDSKELSTLNYRIETNSIPIDYLPFIDLSKPSFQTLLVNHAYFEFLDNSYKLKSPQRNGVSYKVNSFPLNTTELTTLMSKKATRIKSFKKGEIFQKYFKPNDLELSDQEKLVLLNNVFSKQGFTYSLSPPAYDSLESFLLVGNLGYCSHFASSYAFLARLIGLPSRVVTGFLGGEINPFDESIIVRELDAHAWVEVYLNDSGWVRVDPTEMVFPDRLRISNATIADTINPNFFNDRFGYLKTISLWGDAFNSKFDSYLFNLDNERQNTILAILFKNKISIGWFFLAALILGMGLFYILPTLINFNHSSYAHKRYLKFLKSMKKRGITKHHHETALQFACRANQILPDLKPYIDKETAEYLKRTYEKSQKLGK